MAVRGSACGPQTTVQQIISARNIHFLTSSICVGGPSGLLASPGSRCARVLELMILEVVRLLPTQQLQERTEKFRHRPRLHHRPGVAKRQGVRCTQLVPPPCPARMHPISYGPIAAE